MSGAGGGQSEYNQMFERLVESAADDEAKLRGMIAYALYKRSKKEWSEEFNAANSKRPEKSDQNIYVATWTPSRLDGLVAQADGILQTFAAEIISSNRHDIEKEALRGKFWKDVGIGVTASFVFTLLLIAIAIILKTTGINIIAIYQSLGA